MLDRVKRWGDEFKTFAVKGNVIDMAVGIIIGAAFGKVVNSIVADVIMPPIGYLMGKVDFTNLYINLSSNNEYPTLAAAQAAGETTINYGLFINTIINFIIVAFAVFLLIKFINKLRSTVEKKEEVVEETTTKECPRCFSTINIKATKCPNCTSDI